MEQPYLHSLRKIYEEGVDRDDRTGVGTRGLFGFQMRFDLAHGFPAITTKKLAFKAVKSELLWFLEGSNDDNRLKELNGSERTIWTDNAEADYWKPNAKFPGDLGRIYGVQWRSWQKPDGGTVDQIKEVIEATVRLARYRNCNYTKYWRNGAKLDLIETSYSFKRKTSVGNIF